MKTRKRGRMQRAFTLIELLVVIAIIAILAAILFPVFATVRESTRQGAAMSNLHAVYLGARLFYEDEGRYPDSLFGYAEVPLVNSPYDPNKPLSRPAKPVAADYNNVTPMDNATGNFSTNALATNRSLNKGYLFREQIKDYETFLDPDNLVGKQQNGKSQVTTVIYPSTLPTLQDGTSLAGANVVWTAKGTTAGGCSIAGDDDLPFDPSYVGVQKVFYKMDSMDIGPAIDWTNGQVIKDVGGNIVYELHYSPDWTKERFDPAPGKTCDMIPGSPTAKPITAQLKYKNPPTERTILTYITDHVATSGSPNVLILLMSGTARTLHYNRALRPNSGFEMPLNYR